MHPPSYGLSCGYPVSHHQSQVESVGLITTLLSDQRKVYLSNFQRFIPVHSQHHPSLHHQPHHGWNERGSACPRGFLLQPLRHFASRGLEGPGSTEKKGRPRPLPGRIRVPLPDSPSLSRISWSHNCPSIRSTRSLGPYLFNFQRFIPLRSKPLC